MSKTIKKTQTQNIVYINELLLIIALGNGCVTCAEKTEDLEH